MYKIEKKKNKTTLIFFQKLQIRKKEDAFSLRIISRIYYFTDTYKIQK